MGAIPDNLRNALRPVTVVVGHYGAGKTNFCVNLACDLASEGECVTLVDLDIVNPYFRATEQRAALEAAGVNLVAPVFAEAGTSLDVPSLSGGVAPAIEAAGDGNRVIIDAGGDDAGATALGRFAAAIEVKGYAMLYVANRFRNLVADPHDVLENLREIEQASHLRATVIVNNSHLQDETTANTVEQGIEYAAELSQLANLPLVCTTVPYSCSFPDVSDTYRVDRVVAVPWA